MLEFLDNKRSVIYASNTLYLAAIKFLFSSQNVQRYLARCYEKSSIQDAEKKSFENCYPFIYYLEHGKNYYELYKAAPFSIQPMLLFYGISQLFKACLLTIDPNYPESTTVLAHGVTTRKRKKQGYQFLEDEVKIQKNGLFTHVAEQLFHMKHLEAEKFNMLELMGNIPELQNLFRYSQKVSTLYKIDSTNKNELSFSVNILDRLHMTKERFSRYIETTCKHLSIQHVAEKNSESNVFFRRLFNRGILCIVLLYTMSTLLILITYHLRLILEILNPFYLSSSFITYCSII